MGLEHETSDLDRKLPTDCLRHSMKATCNQDKQKMLMDFVSVGKQQKRHCEPIVVKRKSLLDLVLLKGRKRKAEEMIQFHR